MAAKMIGAITEEDAAFVEKWESVSPAVHWVLTTDYKGEEDPQEVKQNEEFFITSKDRLLTEQKIRDQKLNPFTNGSFRPITVPETVSVTTNPNAMSDEHILSVFQASDLAWDEWMGVIDSPATLQRMIQLADGDPRAQISHKRYQVLQRRREEVHPKASLRGGDEELNKFLYDERDKGSGIESIGAKPQARQRAGGGYVR